MASFLFPFIDLPALHSEMIPDLLDALREIVTSSRFIMGRAVQDFERAIASCTGVDHALGVDSGTRALELIYRALGIGPGDEVITTPFTFIATASSILQVGATPVFADVDPVTMNLDPESVRSRITKRTRAITPVHLFGRVADMAALLDAAGALPVVEDACQALGASSPLGPAGSLGCAAAVSFFPTKNLGGAGDGGMVLTNDPKLASRIAILRNHGQNSRGEVVAAGCTGRLDALQAAILNHKLPFLDRWNRRRRENAAWYLDNLPAGVVPQLPDDTGEHVYHQFTVRVPQRDAVQEEMGLQGVPTAVYYPVPAHLQPLFRDRGHRSGECPAAERLSREVLSLPIGPCLRAENRMKVMEVLKNALEKTGKKK